MWLEVSGTPAATEGELPALPGSKLAEVLRRLDKPVGGKELSYIVDMLGGRASRSTGGRLITYEAFDVWWSAMLEEFAAWCQTEESDSGSGGGSQPHHPSVSGPSGSRLVAAVVAAEPLVLTAEERALASKSATEQHEAELEEAVKRSKTEAEKQRWAAHIQSKQQVSSCQVERPFLLSLPARCSITMARPVAVTRSLARRLGLRTTGRSRRLRRSGRARRRS